MSSRDDWRARVDARLEGREPEQPRKKRSVRKKKTLAKAEPMQTTREGSTPQTGITAGTPGADASLHANPESILATPVPVTLDAETSRHNLRTWILTACFTWGLITGFLFYVLRSEEKDIEDTPKPIPVAATNNTTQQKDPEDKTPVSVIKPPEDHHQTPAPGLGISIEDAANLARIRAERDHPVLASQLEELPKTPYGGLTGQNVAMPRFRDTAVRKEGSSAPELDRAPIHRTLEPELEL